ncbi:MAG TPA: hypothetical protein VGL20_01160 [Candidatus Dormibacteraeota bacterium]|jgi:hypothetical protein
MARSAIGAAVGVIAAAGMASCGGGGQAGTTPAPTSPPVATAMPTPATVPPHDLAVALRKVTTQGGAELTATGNDLARAGSLDVAAQTMGDHATTFSSLHSTLDQLPAFPVPQTQKDVGQLSADLASLSSVISAMLAAEVSQYAQFKRQITAQIPTVSRDMATVDNELKSY